MSSPQVFLLTLILMISCTSPDSPEREPATQVHRDGPIDWVERPLRDGVPPLSITAELDFSGDEASARVPTGVICRTQQGELFTPYLIYERREKLDSWGVYGLGGFKNGISMPLPFDPSSIRYEDRTYRQALAEFLVERGATESEAEDFLAGAAPKLFAKGLRVILVLDEPRAPDVASLYLEGSEGPFLLSIELEQLDY